MRVWWSFMLQVGGSGGHLGSKLELWGPSWLQVGGPGAILAPGWGVGRLSWLQVGEPRNSNFSKAQNLQLFENHSLKKSFTLHDLCVKGAHDRLHGHFVDPPLSSDSLLSWRGAEESRETPGREGWCTECRQGVP